MITDIGAILYKEIKELLFQRGQGRSSSVRMLIFIGVFGILLPLQNGIGALTSPAGLVFWAWIPYMLISGITADTFAGERERHTLETLLASRLSDRAILFGKLGAVVGYSWGMTIITILVNLVTVNLVFWQGHVVLYPPLLFGEILLVSLLVALFSAGQGIIISLRSPTARAAQQTMSILMFVLLVPIFLLTLLPKRLLAQVNGLAANLSASQFIVGLIVFLFVVDLGLILYSMTQFQRSKLISD
jgi:ABC-2 type transport system permease protein